MVLLASLLSGLVFGLGLIVSGMANPAKILGFLDLAGAWDPSLAFVMAGAISVGAVAFALALLVVTIFPPTVNVPPVRFSVPFTVPVVSGRLARVTLFATANEPPPIFTVPLIVAGESPVRSPTNSEFARTTFAALVPNVRVPLEPPVDPPVPLR